MSLFKVNRSYRPGTGTSLRVFEIDLLRNAGLKVVRSQNTQSLTGVAEPCGQLQRARLHCLVRLARRATEDENSVSMGDLVRAFALMLNWRDLTDTRRPHPIC